MNNEMCYTVGFVRFTIVEMKFIMYVYLIKHFIRLKEGPLLTAS